MGESTGHNWVNANVSSLISLYGLHMASSLQRSLQHSLTQRAKPGDAFIPSQLL
ncbi:hypothetical protein DPMN_147895 [Dreissena polymorpha]|uniref:Uncharacterized protein n=1 Tax=Dreissena polymorpha TaxID=45954 RepID=A0A9D4J3T6_DREPO|nr:hypothetical protein DPMN_147895 [Dreissena polymorpha]